MCELKYDEEEGVWVCLPCSNKLTTALQNASVSPRSPRSPQHASSSLSLLRRLSEPARPALALRGHSDDQVMTLFLELVNNGNKRRFKYQPYDVHKDESVLQMKQHLLKRFSHDIDAHRYKTLCRQITTMCRFEVNSRAQPHTFVELQTLQDLFHGAQIKVQIDDATFMKRQSQSQSEASMASYRELRRRSKSASSISEELSWQSQLSQNTESSHDDEKKETTIRPPKRINVDTTKPKIIIGAGDRVKKNNDDIVSPRYDMNQKFLPSYAPAFNHHNEDDADHAAVFENDCIIVDNGSGLMKFGFGGMADQGPCPPQIVFPSLYLRSPNNNEAEFGEKALQNAEKLSLFDTPSLIRPVQRGVIENWPAMELMWHTVLNVHLKRLFQRTHHEQPDMQCVLSEHPFLMTAPYANREKMLEVMFEQFDVPSLYIGDAACLSLYGTGRTKGCVLDIGDGVTTVFGMVEQTSLAQNSSAKIIEFGGMDVTNRIRAQYGVSYLHARNIKETLYSVPYDRSDILFADTSVAVYKLPDGQEIKLGKERMMKPLHFMFDAASIHAPLLVTNCIKSFDDVETQSVLWNNIVLSGGTTMMDGFAEKFAKEIKAVTHGKTQVIAGRSRRYLSWVGAAVMSSISTFKNISISKAIYQSHGASRAKELI